MSKNTTLIFPSSISASLSFSHKARSRGDKVIAASSVKSDETSKLYDKWVFLPSIYEKNFTEEFIKTIRKHKVTDFFTPHALVYSTVKKIINENDLDIKIADSSPIELLNNEYRQLIKRAEDVNGYISAINHKSKVAVEYIASILHHAGQIYGQTNETKIATIIALMSIAPKGDVIEIGSAWGRSAFVLSALAAHYKIGNVLCIDPWDAAIASQKNSPVDLESVNQNLDWELMFKIFKINMLGVAKKNLNYVRATSEKAEKEYKNSRNVESKEFGKTVLKGKISVIHIDGNHDYKEVSKDYRIWRKYMVPGSWLILDDYVWEHGSGPQRTGDELIKNEYASIKTCFTAGKALFVNFKEIAWAKK